MGHVVPALQMRKLSSDYTMSLSQLAGKQEFRSYPVYLLVGRAGKFASGTWNSSGLFFQDLLVGSESFFASSLRMEPKETEATQKNKAAAFSIRGSFNSKHHRST